jgi:hypothetical protein
MSTRRDTRRRETDESPVPLARQLGRLARRKPAVLVLAAVAAVALLAAAGRQPDTDPKAEATVDAPNCRSAPECRTLGLCTARGKACVALTADDCASSTACSTDGKCLVSADTCVAPVVAAEPRPTATATPRPPPPVVDCAGWSTGSTNEAEIIEDLLRLTDKYAAKDDWTRAYEYLNRANGRVYDLQGSCAESSKLFKKLAARGAALRGRVQPHIEQARREEAKEAARTAPPTNTQQAVATPTDRQALYSKYECFDGIAWNKAFDVDFNPCVAPRRLVICKRTGDDPKGEAELVAAGCKSLKSTEPDIDFCCPELPAR